jgi:ATP-dependent Clp protease ATP-binding subunit ClpA
MLREEVTADDIAAVVSRWTGVPVDRCWRASAKSCSRWKR